MKKIELIAKSKTAGDYKVAVEVISDSMDYLHNSTRAKIQIKGKEHACELGLLSAGKYFNSTMRNRESGVEAIRLYSDGVVALGYPATQTVVIACEWITAVQDEMKKLSEEKERSIENEIAERKANGTIRYAIFTGGESGRESLEIGYEEKPESGYIDGVVLFRVLRTVETKNKIYKLGNFPRTDKGEYTINGLYGDVAIISEETFNSIISEDITETKRVERVEREKKEKQQAERKAKHQEAIRTGKPVEIFSYSAECNDPHEECDIDIITVYIHPDGHESRERSHTY